jgi:hypothetical protein
MEHAIWKAVCGEAMDVPCAPLREGSMGGAPLKVGLLVLILEWI